MVDFRELFRNPKRLAITAATGIAYFLIRRQFPENLVVDAAAAGGAYYASKRTAGDIKTALEGVALGAGANLALTLAKKAPEAFAAALPTGAPQPQIVVQVPQPQPQPSQPLITVSPQIMLSQSVSQAQQVSQQVSQMVSQLQEQLQQMGRQLEQMAQQSPAQTMPVEISPEEFTPLPSVLPDFTFQPPVIGLPEEEIVPGIKIPVEITPMESGSPSDFTGGVGITYYTTSGMVKLLE